METKPLSVKANTDPVILYYEDLVYFMSLLCEVSEKVTLTVTDNQSEYKFESVSELETLQTLAIEKVNDLSISAYRPYVTIRLWKFGGEVHISEDSMILRGVMEKIRDRIRSRRKALYWAYTHPVFTGAVPMLVAYYGVWELGSKNYIAGTLIVTFSVFWLALNWYSRFYNYSEIFFKPRSELPTFFQRKKDDIYLSVISGFIGAVFGALITAFFTKIS